MSTFKTHLLYILALTCLLASLPGGSALAIPEGQGTGASLTLSSVTATPATYMSMGMSLHTNTP